MKKELTYHGQMMKQEAESLLKALTLGDEKVVMSIEKRLRNFADDIVDGSASIFEETKEVAVLKNSFKMAEKLGEDYARKAFESFHDLWKGDTEKLKALREFLDWRYEHYLMIMAPLAKNMGEVYRECIEALDCDLKG